MLRMSASEHTYSWNVGLLWTPRQWLSLGMSYMAETPLTMEGEATVTDFNPDVNPSPDWVGVAVTLLGTSRLGIGVDMVVPRVLRAGAGVYAFLARPDRPRGALHIFWGGVLFVVAAAVSLAKTGAPRAAIARLAGITKLTASARRRETQ